MSLVIKNIKTIKIVKESQKYTIHSKAKQLSNCPPKTVYTNVSACYRINSPKMLGITKKVGKKHALLCSSQCELYPKMLGSQKKLGSGIMPSSLHSYTVAKAIFSAIKAQQNHQKESREESK